MIRSYSILGKTRLQVKEGLGLAVKVPQGLVLGPSVSPSSWVTAHCGFHDERNRVEGTRISLYFFSLYVNPPVSPKKYNNKPNNRNSKQAHPSQTHGTTALVSVGCYVLVVRLPVHSVRSPSGNGGRHTHPSGFSYWLLVGQRGDDSATCSLMLA